MECRGKWLPLTASREATAKKARSGLSITSRFSTALSTSTTYTTLATDQSNHCLLMSFLSTAWINFQSSVGTLGFADDSETIGHAELL